jgi:N-carbamoylputrescine amidase
MKIALIQQHAGPEKADNVARGLAHMDQAAASGAKLVCFAELAFEPFYPQRVAAGDVRSRAETIPGPITEAFRARAKQHGIVVVLNLFEQDGARAFDSSPVIDANGRLLGVTRMLHITDYPCFHERGYYSPGDRGMPVYDTRIGRIGVSICYDRHYPEVMRALALGGAELVIVPQAGSVGEWPEGLYEGEMRVAAFQNGYFIALCNRVGVEECLEFAGESFVCAPDGTVIARAPQGRDHILYADVELAACRASHARRLFLNDRRPELYAEWFTAASVVASKVTL